MNDLAIIQFSLGFQRELVQWQGFISFGLLLFWVFQARRRLLDRIARSPVDLTWMMFCFALGLGIAFYSLREWGTEFTLVALAIGLSVGFAMIDQAIAACFLICLLFLRPWELVQKNDYMELPLKLTFLICTAHILLESARNRRVSIVWNVTASWLAAFAAWVLITTLAAPDPVDSQFQYFQIFFKGVLLFVAILNAVRTPEDLRTVVLTLLMTFLIVGVISIYTSVESARATYASSFRLEGFGSFANSNDIAALMVLIFPFSLLGTFDRRFSLSGRLLSLILVLIVFCCVYLSKSRGAMLGIGGIFVVLAYLKLNRKRFLIVLTLGCLAAVPVIHGVGRDDASASTKSRLTYVKAGLWMGIKNPVFGVGHSAFPASLYRYATETLDESEDATAHNSWVLVFAESGLMGLLLFVAMYGSCLRVAWRMASFAPEFMLSLVGYGIAITFLSHSYLISPYLLLGLTGIAANVNAGNGASA